MSGGSNRCPSCRKRLPRRFNVNIALRDILAAEDGGDGGASDGNGNDGPARPAADMRARRRGGRAKSPAPRQRPASEAAQQIARDEALARRLQQEAPGVEEGRGRHHRHHQPDQHLEDDVRVKWAIICGALLIYLLLFEPWILEPGYWQGFWDDMPEMLSGLMVGLGLIAAVAMLITF